MNVTIFEKAYLRRVKTLQQPEEINVFVASALRFVLQNVFFNITNTFTATISSGDGPIGFWLHDVMSKLFKTFGLMSLNIVVLDKNIMRLHLPGKRYCNLIMVDSFKSLEKANIAEYNRAYDSLEYYFIFLQIRDNHVMPEMEVIFKYCFDHYWLHCNIMIQNGKGEIYIYTYFPFQEGHCFQTNPILINQFVGDRFVNSVMFPDKLQNLHLCALSLCTWDIPPFVKELRKNAVHSLTGIEMKIVHAIAKDMNFTIDIHQIDTTRYSTYGPFEHLRDRKTNISLGYFRRTIGGDLIGTPSSVTYYLPLVAIVLRKQDQFESMGILTFPFDKYTWLLLLISYGVLVLINSLQRKNNKVNSFQILAVLIGIPAIKAPTCCSRRIRFIIWIITSFILRCIYQSLLFSLFRRHYYISPPPTLDGLVETGYTTVCTQLSEPFVQYVPHIMDETLPLLSLNSSNELEPLRYLESHPDENFAAISIKDFAYYYAATEMIHGNALQVLPIKVNDQQIGFYFTKHSYLKNRFNDYILLFHQAGLLKMWRDWTNFGHLVTSHVGNPGRYEHELMITLKQLMGFFNVALFLLALAIIFFFLELLSKKVVSLQKFFFFINGTRCNLN